MAYTREKLSKLSGYPLKHTRTIGNKGEDIGCTFLEGKGFTIVARNYLKKWGELDIIAEKDKMIHFFEVKSVTTALYRPEDNVHGLKARHLRRIIETYLEETKRGLDAPFQFHVLCVYMNMKTRRARVKILEDLILV